MRKSYIVDTLTSLEIQEFKKIDSKVIQIYDGVVYRENFIFCPFGNVRDNSVALRQNYKDENNDIKQLIVSLIMNSLFGE